MVEVGAVEVGTVVKKGQFQQQTVLNDRLNKEQAA
jgi:hypothetical protein